MDQAAHIHRSCATKRHYASRSAARRAKRIMAALKRQVFSIYRCAYCGNWHITHSKRHFE
jgi:ribosomal protein L32